MPDPTIATTTQPQPIQGVSVQGAPGNPLTPGYSDPAQSANVGSSTAPINYTQQAALFQMPNASNINNQISNMPTMNSPLAGLTTLGNTTNAQAPTINTAPSNALLTGQVSNINALNAQAQGQGPSPAMVAAQQAAQQNENATAALMGSQRAAGNPALNMRTALEQKATADQAAVQAGVAGKTQEELNAQQQLTGALQGATGQTQQGAQAQAGLTSTANLANSAAANAATLQQGSMAQQTALANLQSQLQTGQININEYNAQLQAMITQANNQLTSNQNYANLVTGENTQLYGIDKGVAIANNANQMGLAGAGIAGGAAIGAAGLQALSDITKKTNIRSGDRSIKEFLTKIGKPTSQFNLMGA